MFNKVYKYVKDFILENIVVLAIYIFVLFITLFPVNYYIITGGGTFRAKDKVEIKSNYKEKGSLSFCYVSELKGTVLTYLLSYIIPTYERESMDLYKASKNEKYEDIEYRSRLSLLDTNNTSLLVAFNKAGKKIDVKSKKMNIYYIDDKAKTNLKIGDELISVDGKSIDSFDDLRDYISSKNENDKVDIKVKYNGKEYNRYSYVYKEEDQLYIGIMLQESITYETDPKVKFKFNNSESGPSGGLILTLQVYNKITKNDITKGYNIAGTGTIDSEGNVGEIDGVKYKLMGAVKNKKDIFLVPSGKNYKEAIKEKKRNKYKIKIIEVKTFDDAIEKLENLK